VCTRAVDHLTVQYNNRPILLTYTFVQEIHFIWSRYKMSTPNIDYSFISWCFLVWCSHGCILKSRVRLCVQVCKQYAWIRPFWFGNRACTIDIVIRKSRFETTEDYNKYNSQEIMYLYTMCLNVWPNNDSIGVFYLNGKTWNIYVNYDHFLYNYTSEISFSVVTSKPCHNS